MLSFLSTALLCDALKLFYKILSPKGSINLHLFEMLL